MGRIIYMEQIRVENPNAVARAIGLVYVTDSQPGIRRKRSGTGFRYVDDKGKPIRDKAEIARIRALVIPPAWSDVWICKKSNGHIQATGRDAKGRKQYRYHSLWREQCDQTKYYRSVAFGEALAGIRAQTHKALSRPGLPREKVLATVIQLLDKTGMRVGNEEYAKANQSFGLTTMRDEHVDVTGGTLRFQFRGKSGQEQAFDLRDPRLAKIVKRCQDLPGEELFQYIDENGEQQRVDSSDVNEYLRSLTQQDFTAKDFRTWNGTVHAAVALCGIGGFQSETEAKRNIVQAIKSTAVRLGNKPAACRKYYIHPEILDAYLEGTLVESLGPDLAEETKSPLPTAELAPHEAAVLNFLRKHTDSKLKKVEKVAAPAATQLKRAS